MEITEIKWEIVVPTFNRAKALDCLLNSISNSILKPSGICIVSSGENVDYVLSKYCKLNIKHERSNISSQLVQKSLAIKMVESDTDWIAFLDDDVIIEENTYKNAFEFIVKKQQKYEVSGVGLKFQNISNLNKKNLFKKGIAKLFVLGGNCPGKILSSGHAVSYLSSNLPIETEWLTGISIWKRNIANQYPLDLIVTSYSAYEDVIFSYNFRGVGKLWFCPEAKIKLQSNSVTNYQSYKLYVYSMLWRYYFVKSNNNLSVNSFFWSQLGRSLFYIVNNKKNIFQCLKVATLNFKLIIYIFLDINPKVLLNNFENSHKCTR